jgi:hypothetical protein
MALIQRGSFDSFSAMVVASERAKRPALAGLRTFRGIREATRAVQPAPIEFEVSTTPRGLALKSLKLTQGFEGILDDLFNPTNEIYFLAWAWDLSGAPVVDYPGATGSPDRCIIPLQVGQVRQFLGAGIALFPARKVTAGLALRIMIWESDRGARDFGKTLSEVANTIKASKLNNLLSLVSLATGATTATIALIKDAAIELAYALGKILQANSDDYVDFYEGYYPAADPWTAGEEVHQGNASEIALTRLT